MEPSRSQAELDCAVTQYQEWLSDTDQLIETCCQNSDSEGLSRLVVQWQECQPQVDLIAKLSHSRVQEIITGIELFILY